MNEAESLRIGIAMILLVYIPGIMLLIMAQRHLPREEANRLERARALGEPVDEQTRLRKQAKSGNILESLRSKTLRGSINARFRHAIVP